MKELLEGKNRNVKYNTMPAKGLYLVGVGYNDFPAVDQLSYFRKIMLISHHSFLSYQGRNSSKKLYAKQEDIL
jgi:tRNA U38,U39,U40 pseudouridine synthase TruA